MKSNIIEKEIIIPGKFNLSGTLTVPENNKNIHPVIIIIPGTGKSDRDGNSKKLNMNIYKLLSNFLASMDYATLRYDKRGLYKSEGVFNRTGVSDLLEDIERIFNYLKKLPEIDEDNIFLLGHSEGCILSTIISEKINIKGLILLSGAGVSIKSALTMQSEEAYNEIQRINGIKGFFLKLLYSKNKIKKTQEKLYSKVNSTDKNVVKFLFKEFPAKWLREHLRYNDEYIQNILKTKDIPILCITGDKDVQANPDDLKLIDNFNNNNISVKIIENMDHILKYYDGNKTILNLTKQYKNESNKTLHSKLKNAIEYWLEKSTQ